MSHIRNTFSFLRRFVAPRDARPAQEEPTPDESTDDAEGFGDLLAGIGAEAPPEDESATLALKDATIAELQRNLRALTSLGDELAQTEQRRMAAEVEIEELRSENVRLENEVDELRAGVPDPAPVSAGTGADPKQLEKAVAHLEAALAKQQAARGRTEERLAKTRVKFEERKRMAAERWHEIRRLRRERNDLASELESERARSTEIATLVRESIDEAPEKQGHVRLIDLLRLVPGESDPAQEPASRQRVP